MWSSDRKRTLALSLIIAAAVVAVIVGMSVSTHTASAKHVQGANQLASTPTTGVSHTASASHPYVGPCRRCLAAHPYEAKVLGAGPLAG